MAVVKVTLRSGVKCLTNLKSLSSYQYIDTKIKTLGAIFDKPYLMSVKVKK